MAINTAQVLASVNPASARPVSAPHSDQPVSKGTARLTRRLAIGEEEAFREFHSLYFDRLYQFLLVVARGNEDEAREALQETLLRVVRHARTFDNENAFWSWLKAVARNAARDGGRKRSRYLDLLNQFTVHGQIDSQDATAEDDHLRALLHECLAEMPESDRQLIEGKYLRGETVRELAGQSGATEKAVESRLGRLRRHLRERLMKGMSER